jgi:hypothetical protein
MLSVAPPQQPGQRLRATWRLHWSRRRGGTMFARMTVEGRLFGFDFGDWSVLLTGLALTGFLALLV